MHLVLCNHNPLSVHTSFKFKSHHSSLLLLSIVVMINLGQQASHKGMGQLLLFRAPTISGSIAITVTV
jgi:hypothetical protein